MVTTIGRRVMSASSHHGLQDESPAHGVEASHFANHRDSPCPGRVSAVTANLSPGLVLGWGSSFDSPGTASIVMRDLVRRYVDNGVTKFVVRPNVPPESWETELHHLADTLFDLQN